MTPRRRIVPAVPRPPLTPREAAERISRIADTVSRLTAVIVEETRLVRLGRYEAASRLEGSKGELSGRYALDVEGLNGRAEDVAAQPRDQVAEIEKLHVEFRAALDENLLVLGTARSVAEGLMRGVAEEISAKQAPQTYGASGSAYGQRPSAAPISISRGA